MVTPLPHSAYRSPAIHGQRHTFCTLDVADETVRTVSVLGTCGGNTAVCRHITDLTHEATQVVMAAIDAGTVKTILAV
jgi:hypothetical protein